MIDIPPKWALKIYSQLWYHFNTTKFSKIQAKQKITSNNLSQSISKLKNCGWLIIEADPDDSRRSLYVLKNPKSLINEIGRRSN